MVDVLLTEVRPSRLDERVQLGEEGDGPHEVAAGDGEDDRGAPEPGFGRVPLVVVVADGTVNGVEGVAYTWFSPLGEKNHAARPMATHTTRPMMTLQLRESVLARCRGVCERARRWFVPVGHFARFWWCELLSAVVVSD